ncbi:MAG: L,D-transpeptidase family protein, partial [Sphaerospermopsis sp. SIO1G2]|nr:L,D-transpeptidase family protein [Sphaerospermopsis sp. SIO1G2]
QRYGLSNDWLQLLNPGYSDTRLRAGQRLKVFDASQLQLRLLVQRQFFRCWLVAKSAHGQAILLASYPVGIGQADRATPLGTTTFRHAVLDPEWTHPDTGMVYGPHHPDNVLGGYWLGLKPGDRGQFHGIGFHGYTGAPTDDWLEKPGSRGCLRLRQADIHQLYAVIRKHLSTQVTVVD